MAAATRNVKAKIIRLLRTDSSTPKCVIPKGAMVTKVTSYCETAVDAGTPNHAFTWTGGSGGQIFLATRGQGVPSFSGANTLIGVVQPADRKILSTFTASSSTSGAFGFAIIEYIPGFKDGEAIDS